MCFDSSRLWISSADFTNSSRRSLEFGYWTEDKALWTAPSGFSSGLSRRQGSTRTLTAWTPTSPTLSPDNVHETGVSPGGQSRFPVVAADAEQVERTRRKTCSRARSEVFVPYRRRTASSMSRSRLFEEPAISYTTRRSNRYSRANSTSNLPRHEGGPILRTHWSRCRSNGLCALQAFGPPRARAGIEAPTRRPRGCLEGGRRSAPRTCEVAAEGLLAEGGGVSPTPIS
jgi:hypothetical protein